MSHKKLGPIGSAVLTFIGYKQTNKQTNKQTDRQAKSIYRLSPYVNWNMNICLFLLKPWPFLESSFCSCTEFVGFESQYLNCIVQSLIQSERDCKRNFKWEINVFVSLNCIFSIAGFLQKWLAHFLFTRSNWRNSQK